MVSTVTKFRACDGSEWVRQSDAEKRERDILRVKEIIIANHDLFPDTFVNTPKGGLF